MTDYGSEPSVYPSNGEEEVNRIEKHRRGLQENLTQVDEQIAAITGIGLKEESGEKGAGLNHQESNTSIEKSSGYGSVDSPESGLNSQFFNSDFGIGPEQKTSNFMVTALLSNRRPQAQPEVNKKGLWDANAAERKRHSHHYGHTYNNYTTAHYIQYQQMQQQQQQQQQQQYYGSYDSMYVNSYAHYQQPRGNYASIQQFANYAAIQLEQANRAKQLKRAQEVAMFQQYGNMTGLYQNVVNRPASAAGMRLLNYDGTMRSSSTPDRLKKPAPLEPMSKEQMAWYLKNPLDFNAAIEAAIRHDKTSAVPNGAIPSNRLCFTSPVPSVPPPPGFEKIERH